MTKIYHMRQGDAGERLRLEADCAWNKQAADQLRVELEAVKDQLAKESEWVRVYKQDRDDALAELAQAREQLADRAIIEVPVGLPSTEELAEISWNAWCDSQEKLCLNYLDYWKELRDTDRISYIESIRAVLQHLAPYLLPNAPAQNIDQPKHTTPDIAV